MLFSELGLAEPILRSIAAEGYSTPTPIQSQAIPLVLAGRDVLGCAQTGTGKTAAFALPILQRLMSKPAAAPEAGPGGPRARAHRPIRALVLSPTRELALQIVQNLAIYARHTGLRHAAIFGGVNQNPQVRALKDGVDIVVATPGRLIDLMDQGYVDLRRVEAFVLDEADRMLDMGFIEPIRRIAARVPQERQTLLFSATMPGPIRKLADALLRDPANIEVKAKTSAPALIGQGVYHVRRGHKPQLLTHVLTREYIGRALVFTRTKHGADKLVRHLHRDGIHAEAIHGNKRQNVRQRTLANFRDGRTTVLVATDIAARGIDVDDVTHVVNFDIPNEPETYVHRIGRTGRAGAAGVAISFCDHEERNDLKSIERLLKRAIEVHEDHPEYKALPAPEARQGGHGNGNGHGHGHAPRDSRHSQGPRKGPAQDGRREQRHGRPRAEQPQGRSEQAGNRGTSGAPVKAFNPLARHKSRGRPMR
jgi:ATP-dependent RNA helicase RhlE